MFSVRHDSRGFTLVEVLVSLLILLIGLLGIAAMMLKGQRASFEAYQRQQALAMAQEMAEKLRSNPGGSLSYVTGTADGPNMPGRGGLFAVYESAAAAADKCLDPAVPCDATKTAQVHLATWDGVLLGAAETKDTAANRIGGIIGALGCIEQPDLAQPVFWVSVTWQGESDTVAPPATASTCGLGQYGTDARRRLVTLTVATCPLAAGGGCA